MSTAKKSRILTEQDQFAHQIDEFQTLPHADKQNMYDHAAMQAEWDRAGRTQRLAHIGFWVAIALLLCLIVWARTASAEVSPDLIRAAQKQAEMSRRNAWQEGTENHTQPVDKVIGADGSVALAQNAPTEIVNVGTRHDMQLGVSDRHTTITVIPPAVIEKKIIRPIIKEKGKASTHNRITGKDFDSSLTIPEDTGPDAIRALELATTQATERYREKLANEKALEDARINNDYNKAVLTFNSDLFKLTTSRQTALGWLSLPLLVLCSLCGVYIFRAVTHDRRERLKVELGVMDKGRG